MPETPDEGTVDRTSLTPASTAAVAEALGKAAHRQLDSMKDLQRAIEACVAELRDRGVPPERMLIAIKALVRRTAVTNPPPGNAASSWAADGYLDDVVRWSIAEYYRAGARR